MPHHCAASSASGWLEMIIRMSARSSAPCARQRTSWSAWSARDTMIATRLSSAALVRRQRMENWSARAANRRSRSAARPLSPSRWNSSRRKNVPPNGSVEYCCDSVMFAPLSNRNWDTAATMPGRSGQVISSRPTSAYRSSGSCPTASGHPREEALTPDFIWPPSAAAPLPGVISHLPEHRQRSCYSGVPLPGTLFSECATRQQHQAPRSDTIFAGIVLWPVTNARWCWPGAANGPGPAPTLGPALLQGLAQALHRDDIAVAGKDHSLGQGPGLAGQLGRQVQADARGAVAGPFQSAQRGLGDRHAGHLVGQELRLVETAQRRERQQHGNLVGGQFRGHPPERIELIDRAGDEELGTRTELGPGAGHLSGDIGRARVEP